MFKGVFDLLKLKPAISYKLFMLLEARLPDRRTIRTLELGKAIKNMKMKNPISKTIQIRTPGQPGSELAEISVDQVSN